MSTSTLSRPAPGAPALRPQAGAAARDLRAQLRGVRLFAPLSPAALDEIAARGLPRTYPRRAILFRKGDRCGGLHVVLEGRVEIYASSPDGREQVLHRIGARQAVTQLPLFDGSTYPATARAAAESRILFVPAEVVEQLCFNEPELLRVVIGDLGRSVRRLTRLVEKVSLKDVRARVATALLEQADAAAAQEGADFRLGATQEQLAAGLGVARESVARALSALRAAGLIAQHGRDVRLLDRAALSAIAEGRPAGAPARAADALPAAATMDGPCC